MPNHVTTRCVVTGPKADVALFHAASIVAGTDEDSLSFDFNTIISMPVILKEAESSTAAEEGVELLLIRGEAKGVFSSCSLYPAQINRIRAAVAMPEGPLDEVAAAYLTKHPEVEQAGLLRLAALIETGFVSWYPWSCAKWGTKWNSYSFELTCEAPLEFTFQTAWSFPTPIFEALAAQYPTLHFHCACFDEGWMFAGEGFFNPPEGEAAFAATDASDELYEKVYGERPEKNDKAA